MAKRVTIRKEGNHYVISIGGRGMSLANTKAEANKKAAQYRKQLKKKK
jgi:hypothetical protein